MIWLLRDFDLLAVLLHATALTFEALLLGGVAFLLFAARPRLLPRASLPACLRLMRWAAASLVVTEMATIAITSASMLAGSTMGWRDLLSASFVRAEVLTILLAIALGFSVRLIARDAGHDLWIASAALGMLGSIVFLSHAVSQMHHRLLLAALTALHHLGTAAWLGAMPFLLLVLKGQDNAEQNSLLLRRYSVMALVSAGVLVAAGTGMAWFYVGSPQGLYGTSYGLMLLAKIYLLLLMLTLGAGNWYALRSAGVLPASLLLRLRRFSEAEIGLGCTVLLAAASLTAQSPSADVMPQDMVSAHTYRMLMTPQWPRLSSPPFRALTPPTSMRAGVEAHAFGESSVDDANDKAWSDYNHHWAGLMVLLAGALAMLCSVSRQGTLLRWARLWPLAFAGLAFFIVLRADPEAWPLGPRPFWASFSYPDVLEHRVEALLIIAFAAFEAAVQTGKLQGRAAMVFPLICAVGAALLLTHSHGLTDGAPEVIAEASHTAIAVLGATVAWARWLQLRLTPGRSQRLAGLVWPAALILVSLVLLNYREV